MKTIAEYLITIASWIGAALIAEGIGFSMGDTRGEHTIRDSIHAAQYKIQHDTLRSYLVDSKNQPPISYEYTYALIINPDTAISDKSDCGSIQHTEWSKNGWGMIYLSYDDYLSKFKTTPKKVVSGDALSIIWNKTTAL